MNRRILALAIPNMLTTLTIPLLGMVDMAIVGRLGQDALLGALSIGTTIFNFIYWNFAFLRMGTSGLVAQAYGGRASAQIAPILLRSVALALLVGAGVVAAQRPIGALSLGIMHGSEAVMRGAADYFYARVWAVPGALCLFALQGWFIGMQNARFPLYTAIVLNLLNVALSLLFVFGFRWGIAGVAWGTAGAQYGALALALWLARRYYGRFFRGIDWREVLDLRPIGRFLRINRDIFLRTFCVVTVYTFFTSASSGMGDTLLAVNALLMQLFTIFSYMMDGFAYAAESLIGRYVGARNLPLIRSTLRRLLWWSGGVALVNILLFGALWRPLLGLFTRSGEILAAAGNYIGWVVLIPLLGFAPFLVDGALIGATATRVMRNSVFWSTVLFFGAYYGLCGALGNDALWFAFILFLVARGILQYTMTGGLKRWY